MSAVCLRAVCARYLLLEHPIRLSKASVICRRTQMGHCAILHPQQKRDHFVASSHVEGGMGLAQCRGLANTSWLQKEHSADVTADKFKVIYRFPGIRICRTISRLKLLQTSITLVFLPPVYYLYWLGDLSHASVVYTTGIAVFACVMLYSVSYFLRRIIGMMYLNDGGTTVKVSHLTFWGRRKDLFVPVENIMALSETGDNPSEILLRLKQYNSPRVLYFTLRYGQIVDQPKFFHVFGRFH
ncbi:transmembrane protein 186 isoform X2 [Ambystoma mexicanum]